MEDDIIRQIDESIVADCASEIERLKNQVAELKRKAENDHDDRKTLLDKNERLERRLRRIKEVVHTDPFFQK